MTIFESLINQTKIFKMITIEQLKEKVTTEMYEGKIGFCKRNNRNQNIYYWFGIFHDSNEIYFHHSYNQATGKSSDKRNNSNSNLKTLIEIGYY